MRPSKVLGVAAFLMVLAVGCSTKSSGPPDPSLSYAVVAKNTSQYKGKRVRWYGSYSSGKFKDGKNGKGSSVDAVFSVDDPVFSVHPVIVDSSTLLLFAVDAESQETNVSLMSDIVGKSCWVTGTVAGTRTVAVTVGAVEKDAEVPLLRDVQFDGCKVVPFGPPAK